MTTNAFICRHPLILPCIPFPALPQHRTAPIDGSTRLQVLQGGRVQQLCANPITHCSAEFHWLHLLRAYGTVNLSSINFADQFLHWQFNYPTSHLQRGRGTYLGVEVPREDEGGLNSPLEAKQTCLRVTLQRTCHSGPDLRRLVGRHVREGRFQLVYASTGKHFSVQYSTLITRNYSRVKVQDVVCSCASPHWHSGAE